MFKNNKTYLKKKDLPTGDIYDLPISDQRLPDGTYLRIEIPTCNSPDKNGVKGLALLK